MAGKTILTPHQKTFLDMFQTEPLLYRSFYFTGGTCLAEFYLQHRLSEDLDFFSEEEFQAQDISVILKKYQNAIGYTSFDLQQSFNRNMFFLSFDGVSEKLKVEFTYFPFTHVEQPVQKNTLQISSLKDIAVNKVFTIAQNPRGRDYYDLYEIMRHEHWTIDELVKLARIKFDVHIDRVQLGGHLREVETKLDDPILVKKLERKTVIDFFNDLAQSFKSMIFI